MAHFSEYRKKDGTRVYRVRVVTGYQTDGTPVQESRTFSNKTEAKKGAREWEAQISQGRSGATAKTTLAEYLDEWLNAKPAPRGRSR